MLMRSALVFCAVVCGSLWAGGVMAEEMAVADGKIVFQIPEAWKKVKPKSNIVEHECQVLSKGEEELPGRVTVMGAGGSVEDNIARWVGQFEPGAKKEQKELTIAGQKVHYVDLSGTFNDKPAPFAPGVKRENYRMLGAIVVHEKLGQYFVKFYGPKDTVAANEDAFKQMIDGLKVK